MTNINKNQPITTIVDAIGLNCPLPILRTRQAMIGLSANDVIKVLATDVESKADFPVFCEQLGHDLISISEENGVFEFIILMK